MKKKTYYYVLVCTTSGPKFVTGTGDHHYAHWDVDKKPMWMSKKMAEQMTFGLCLNGFIAYTVCSDFTLDSHPYPYDSYKIEFKEKTNA